MERRRICVQPATENTHDFAKDDDEGRRGDDGCEASTKVAEEDGECLVDDDVSEEQDDENPVLSSGQESQHLCGPAPLRVCTGAAEDLQVELIESHEGEGEACEDSTEENEACDGEKVEGLL